MRAVWRYPVLALAALGVLGIPNPARAQNAAAHSDEDNNFFELNIYGGYSDYQKIPAGLGNKIQRRRILGGRVTENFWNYVGYGTKLQRLFVEQVSISFESSQRNATCSRLPDPHSPAGLGWRLHFTPRDHKFRPFIAIGAGRLHSMCWARTRNSGRANFLPGAGSLALGTTSTSKATTGVGVKYQANKWFGVRMDVRGNGACSGFGLPGTPSLQAASISRAAKF